MAVRNIQNPWTPGEKLYADDLNDTFKDLYDIYFFGDGSDGNVVITSNTTLTRDMYYNNLTINSGVTLEPNGYKIYVKNNLSGGTISSVGGGGIGGLGNGGIGGNSDGSGGKGGKGGNQDTFSGGLGGTVLSPIPDSDIINTINNELSTFLNVYMWLTTFDFSSNSLRGSGGGGGGSGGTTNGVPDGGKGGIGAGRIVIFAKKITGTGTITANGTKGENGRSYAAGGGGGGGGGYIVLVYETLDIGVVITADGGLGGTPNGPASSGDPGEDGTIIQVQV